jgi:rhodanese-related sulfurtransferase
MDPKGNPLLTLLDFRVIYAQYVKTGGDLFRIRTSCRTITAQLDDFIDNQQLIDSIPLNGKVVTISETGNRDDYLIRFMHAHGHDNLMGLRFGMRDWLKAAYPTIQTISPDSVPKKMSAKGLQLPTQ